MRRFHFLYRIFGILHEAHSGCVIGFIGAVFLAGGGWGAYVLFSTGDWAMGLLVSVLVLLLLLALIVIQFRVLTRLWGAIVLGLVHCRRCGKALPSDLPTMCPHCGRDPFPSSSD